MNCWQISFSLPALPVSTGHGYLLRPYTKPAFFSAVARIRDTTQILLDFYHVDGRAYIHPLKVWDRYSSSMFIPHVITGNAWEPGFRSGDAAALSLSASKRPNLLSGSIAPWDSVYSRLIQYRDIAAELPDAAREVAALQQELSRMLIGNHPDFNKLSDRYLSIDDLVQIRSRMIGSGRIGGKAAGMLVARKVLLQKNGGRDFSRVLEAHDSFYIGSDVFFTFLVNNNLFRLKSQLSRNAQISPEEFEKVEQQFLEESSLMTHWSNSRICWTTMVRHPLS
jgi:hypothetical protein